MDTDKIKRQIFREERFDKSTHSFLNVLLGITACMLLPIGTACAIFTLLRNHYEGFEPGSPIAAACGWLFIAGIVISSLSTYYFARSHAIGNKYKYFLIDEKGRLFYTNSGREEIFSYFSKNVDLKEKLSSTPNVLFGLTFFHGLKPLYGGFSYIKMENFFKYNQKHKLAESLLSSDDYLCYCRQIVAVQNIKFFSGGCTTVFSLIKNGEAVSEKCTIYTTMRGYREVVGYLINLMPKENVKTITNAQLKQFEKQSSAIVHISESEYTNHFEEEKLSAFEMKQAKEMIIRKNMLSLLFVFLFIIIAIISILHRESVIMKAGSAEVRLFSNIYGWLGARAYRRIFLSLFWMLLAFVSAVKYIRDLICAKDFYKKEVTVLEYSQSLPRAKAIFENYRHTALVEYLYADVQQNAVLGISEELWNHRENGNAVLIMNKNLPYFVIMEDSKHDTHE